MSTGYTVLSQTECFEYDGSNQLIYQGWATIGSSKADSKWRICKFTYSNGLVTDIQFAEGSDSFRFVWNDRATYNYS